VTLERHRPLSFVLSPGHWIEKTNAVGIIVKAGRNLIYMSMNPISSHIPVNYVASNIPGELRMLDVLRDRFSDSQEIAISVSFLRYSGLGLIVDDFKYFVKRGGRVRILTSTYLGRTQPEALQQLLKITGLNTCRKLTALLCGCLIAAVLMVVYMAA
jgi:hypothetical protein